MEILADSITTAVINAPLEKINLTEWLFNLNEHEYQACSPAHIACGRSISKDGKRISLNVEQIAGNLLVQHYIENIAQRDHCKVNSISDSFSAMGRTKLEVIWELKVKKLSDASCEFSNRVIVKSTNDFLELLKELKIDDHTPIKIGMKANVKEHNDEETPFFAKDIETKALGS